jgi:hypothetical protein
MWGEMKVMTALGVSDWHTKSKLARAKDRSGLAPFPTPTQRPTAAITRQKLPQQCSINYRSPADDGYQTIVGNEIG